MCKPSMFSYRAGLLQTAAAKRAENHFNGVAETRIIKSAQAKRGTHLSLLMTDNILRWTLARTSFIVESLRKPSL